MTQRWEEDADIDALNQAMATIASTGQVIKHCVETVPLEVTRALARATTQAGYRHLFVYRKQPLGRLLSLHFARDNDIWGPEMKTGREPTPEDLRRQSLPVPRLLAHEQRCAAALGEMWSLLLGLSQSPSALAYEDLYAAPSQQQAQEVLGRVLSELELQVPPASLPAVLARVLGSGDQGTRASYDQYQGVDELAQALAAAPRFEPAPPLVHCTVSLPAVSSPWVSKASMESPHAVVPRRRRIEGLVVLAPGVAADRLRLLLQGPDGLLTPVKWGIRSMWAARAFPESPNASSARFAFNGELPDGVARLVLEDQGSGERQACLEIHTAGVPAAG